MTDVVVAEVADVLEAPLFDDVPGVGLFAPPQAGNNAIVLSEAHRPVSM